MEAHSKDFVHRWNRLLMDIYGYKEFMDYLIVPSILGKKTLSYSPLLNYTDRLVDQVDDLLELGKDNDYLIRVLDPHDKTYHSNDMVTMRLCIEGRDQDDIFKQTLHSKCRNQIRKSRESQIIVESGQEELLDGFYWLYAKTMHRYGTPALSRIVFSKIISEFDVDIVVANYKNEPVASIFVVYDEKIAWVGWGASRREYLKFCPNHAVYWIAIQNALERGKGIFDFGRSGYAGPTYHFKKQWGTEPVKIKHITNHPDQDLYAKYRLVSKIWQYTPERVVNYLGPKLCRYLVDL